MTDKKTPEEEDRPMELDELIEAMREMIGEDGFIYRSCREPLETVKGPKNDQVR